MSTFYHSTFKESLTVTESQGTQRKNGLVPFSVLSVTRLFRHPLRGLVMISFSFPGFTALTPGFIPPPSGLNLGFVPPPSGLNQGLIPPPSGLKPDLNRSAKGIVPQPGGRRHKARSELSELRETEYQPIEPPKGVTEMKRCCG